MFDLSEVQTIIQLLGETLAVSATVAVLILAGYAVFKLLTLASFLLLIKYIVEKIYALISAHINKPAPPVVNKLEISGHLITHDATPDLFVSLLADIRGLVVTGSEYVHSRDVLKAIKIIREEKSKND